MADLIEIEPISAWGREERELSSEVAAALAATEVVKIIPLKSPGRWLIEADSRVGILIGEGWELAIRPHIEIAKLLFLLTYSLRPQGWEGALTEMASEPDLVQALACGFCLHTEHVLEQGLQRGYVSVEERRNDLRGRVRFGDQLARLAGLPLPLEVAYDDFTIDIAENRLLRTAIETLLLLPRISSLTRARLFRLRAALEQVSVLGDRRRIDLPQITRLNVRYQAALVLAKLILEKISLSQKRGAIMVTSFLFDMNEVFESFLFTALRESLREFGGVVQSQVNGALDRARKPGLPLRADIVWRKQGAVRAVIDSKYKALGQADSTPNEDAYQMLAYCIAFGVRRGLLVYARDGIDDPRTYAIKRHEYEIAVRSVGLDQEPAQLLSEVGHIADEIASSAPQYIAAAC